MRLAGKADANRPVMAGNHPLMAETWERLNLVGDTLGPFADNDS